MPALVLIVGCSSRHNLQPLELGQTWTYRATSGLSTRITTISIQEMCPVGQYEGYVLNSDLGDSTMAWAGNTLLVGKMGNSEFFPPIPIYQPIDESKSITWKGTIRNAGTSQSANANLKITQADESYRGKKVKMVVSQISMKVGAESHDLTTWFLANKGIYQQEHRVNDKLVTRLNYESGP